MKTKFSKPKEFINELNTFLQASKKAHGTIEEAIQDFCNETDHYVTEKDFVVRKVRAFRPDWEIQSIIFKLGKYVLKLKTKDGIGHIFVKVKEGVYTYGFNNVEVSEI